MTVSAEVPEPLITEDGLNLQVGGSVTAAEPCSVMLPQESATLWLNPPADVTVTVVAADPPAETDVGEKAAAEIVKPAPAPDRTIFCGLSEASSATVTAPARLPVVVGLNVIEIWQLPPAASDVLHVLVSPKSPVGAIPVMLSALLPTLVKFTSWGVLVVPTFCEANVSEFGFRLAIGPSPVPARLDICGLPGAVSLIATPPVRDPAAVGVNVTLTVQLPAAGNEVPQLLT